MADNPNGSVGAALPHLASRLSPVRERSSLAGRFSLTARILIVNILSLALLSGVVFKLARGDRKAGKDHLADTPEEPEEY